MEKKYYTPELKEFHSGFEYEYLSLGLYEDGPEPFWGWYKRVFELDQDYIFTEKRDDPHIRVKFLDREDIKWLGFEEMVFTAYSENMLKNLKFTKNTNHPRFKNESVILVFNESNGHCVISVSDKTIFVGTIKNKSELLKIMQMLHINI